MEATVHTQPRWNPWPVSIIAFFTVAILGCAGLVAFCNLHPTELVTPDYYEQELHYQGQIQRLEQPLAQATTLTYEPATKCIRIALPAQQAHANITGQIQLYRPSAAGQDRQLRFQPDATGVQSVDASTLQPGLWKVRVSWKAGQTEYFIDRKVEVRQP